MRGMEPKRDFIVKGLATFLFLVFLPVSVWAADYYVAVTGNNANDGSVGAPWKTITHALDQAIANDVIHVASVTYSTLATGESFPLVMKPGVTLSGANRDTTILDAANAAGVIYAEEVSSGGLSNFTVTNGKAGKGGGINAVDSGINITNNIIRNNEAANGGAINAKGFSGTISGNTITSNLATDTGGGIRLVDSNAGVSGNVISNNQAGAGAGFYVTDGSSTISANQITQNTAYMHGGGLYVADCAGSIDRNTILSNEATRGSGGGIYAVNFSGSLNNNLIAKNVADAVAGLYASGFDANSEIINNTIADNIGTLAESVGGMQAAGVLSVLKNNIFWNNGADDLYGGLEGAGTLAEGTVGISYSLINDYVGTRNNIYGDPLFINTAGNDYHLNDTSPAIDVGTSVGAPTLDLDGNLRLYGSSVDMGAYEYASAPPPVCGNGVIELPEECDDGNTVDGDGCSSTCQIEATVCEIKTDYTPGVACASSTVVVNNDAELDAYLTDFGFNGSKYQNLNLNYDVARTNINIHSPCKIKLKGNVVLTGDNICLDGRAGVKDNNGYTANAASVTILSELGPAGFGQGSAVNAGELTISGLKTVKIGKNSQVNVTGAVRVISTGDLPRSDAVIRQGATVNAGSLVVEASRGAIIGKNVELNLSGEASVTSTGNYANSHAKIKQGAVVSANSLNMTSGNKASLKKNTSITTTGNFHMQAASPNKCAIAGSATINAGSTSGNCF